MSAAGDNVSQFTGKKYISVETYRKTGKPVRTAVWFVEENGELLFRTDAGTGKVKRTRSNLKVRVASCNFRGVPNGPWVDGEVRTLDQGSAEHVFSLLRKKYGIAYKAVRFLGWITRSEPSPLGMAIRPSY